jgi:hypothetical protein
VAKDKQAESLDRLKNQYYQAQQDGDTVKMRHLKAIITLCEQRLSSQKPSSLEKSSQNTKKKSS